MPKDSGVMTWNCQLEIKILCWDRASIYALRWILGTRGERVLVYNQRIGRQAPLLEDSDHSLSLALSRFWNWYILICSKRTFFIARVPENKRRKWLLGRDRSFQISDEAGNQHISEHSWGRGLYENFCIGISYITVAVFPHSPRTPSL